MIIKPIYKYTVNYDLTYCDGSEECISTTHDLGFYYESNDLEDVVKDVMDYFDEEFPTLVSLIINSISWSDIEGLLTGN